MRRPLALRPMAVAVLTAAVVLTGCSSGGKDGDEAATPTTATAAAPAAPAAPAQEITGGPFCEFALTFNDRFGRITPDAANPQRLRATMEEATQAIEDAEKTAPSEIRADVALLAATFRDFMAVLEQAGYDFTRLQPASFQHLQRPEAQAASDSLETYISRNCRVG